MGDAATQNPGAAASVAPDARGRDVVVVSRVFPWTAAAAHPGRARPRFPSVGRGSLRWTP
ncbi:hypothetical protein GCM10007061_07210 [Kocuria marina]|nr:hypothetical protein GCM10007061_07210 [Kocuria marina]